jgi:hypothetical protein
MDDEKILWTEYIARNNPDALNYLLEQYGYLRAYSLEERLTAIDTLQQEYGHEATINLLRIHPDYEMIVEDNEQLNPPKEIIKEVEVQQPQVQVSDPVKVSVDNGFHNTLKDVLLIIGAIWLVKIIISKD